MNTVSISKLRGAVLTCAVAATAALYASHAFAQEDAMQVKVPFAFHSGSQQMPAGVYTVEIQSNQLVLLRGRSKSGYLMTNPEETRTPSGTGKLIFHRYGEQYFLSEIWTRESRTGQRAVKTRQEKEAELAQNWTSPVTRELALNQLPR